MPKYQAFSPDNYLKNQLKLLYCLKMAEAGYVRSPYNQLSILYNLFSEATPIL